jgi:hypothetical protein
MEIGVRNAAAVLLLLILALGEGAQEHYRWLRRSECTTSVPFQLQVFGIDNMCVDFTLKGCSQVLGVGLRFARAQAAFAETEVSTGNAPVCVSAVDLGDSPIDYACGAQWSLCLRMDRMVVGQNYFAGCPTIEIAQCKPPWSSGAPMIVPLPLDCFESGFECRRQTNCDECIANGCGWCADDEKDGAEGKGSCQDGNIWGPLCEDCGSLNCSCSWNYGKCPLKKVDMAKMAQEIKDQSFALANVSSQLTRTFDRISTGDSLLVSPMSLDRIQPSSWQKNDCTCSKSS